jgi:hypothetical protein
VVAGEMWCTAPNVVGSTSTACLRGVSWISDRMWGIVGVSGARCASTDLDSHVIKY